MSAGLSIRRAPVKEDEKKYAHYILITCTCTPYQLKLQCTKLLLDFHVAPRMLVLFGRSRESAYRR